MSAKLKSLRKKVYIAETRLDCALYDIHKYLKKLGLNMEFCVELLPGDGIVIARDEDFFPVESIVNQLESGVQVYDLEWIGI